MIGLVSLLDAGCLLGDLAGHPAVRQVATGAVGDVAGAGEDHAADRVIAVGEIPRVGEPHEHVGHQGVASLGTVHREQ
jgi:hypothetical protein